MQRCRRTDHPELAAAHPEPPVVNGRGRLDSSASSTRRTVAGNSSNETFPAASSGRRREGFGRRGRRRASRKHMTGARGPGERRPQMPCGRPVIDAVGVGPGSDRSDDERDVMTSSRRGRGMVAGATRGAGRAIAVDSPARASRLRDRRAPCVTAVGDAGGRTRCSSSTTTRRSSSAKAICMIAGHERERRDEREQRDRSGAGMGEHDHAERDREQPAQREQQLTRRPLSGSAKARAISKAPSRDRPRGDGVEQSQRGQAGPDEDDDADRDSEQSLDDEPDALPSLDRNRGTRRRSSRRRRRARTRRTARSARPGRYSARRG